MKGRIVQEDDDDDERWLLIIKRSIAREQVGYLNYIAAVDAEVIDSATVRNV